MKKKILLFVLSGVMALGAIGLVASCTDNSETTHTHTYEQTASTEATCTEPGSITKTCSGCGDVVTETVKALGHDYTSAKSEDGTKIIYTCSRCGDTYEEAVKIDDPDPSPVGDVLEFTANNAVLSYDYSNGAVSVAIDGSAADMSSPVAVTNNDTDGAWWNGGTESLSVSGDFVVQYTWTNSRDASYTDAVVEITDGTLYWDQTTFADLWGDLYTGATTTSAKYYLNGAETTAVALGTEGYFGGEYTATIVRNGDQLIVLESVVKTNGDTYAYVITQSGFTTADVSTCLTGNPYWIDDIKVSFCTPSTDMLSVTVNYVDEAGNTVAESVSKYVSEGGTATFTSPYVTGYTPEYETYKVKNVTESASYNVVYSECYWNGAETVDTGYITGSVAMTLPESITMKSGVTISFLLSGCTDDWTAMITSLGYSITYGNLDSWARNGHNCYPSLTAYGAANATALKATKDEFLNSDGEIFVAVTVRQDSIIFYVNGERVIFYDSSDKLNGDSYEYYVGTWAANILNGMINYGYTFNAATYKVHRYAVQPSVSDHYIAELYNVVKDSYNGQVVVKCINAEDGLIGEYRWEGIAIDYSITPPDILGYVPEDTSVITGRADCGRTDVVINYIQRGISTIIFRYVDESGSELLPSETVKVTIPSYSYTPPEIDDYVCTNPVYEPTALIHGKTYIQTFVYKVDTASHKYVNGVCSDCGKACLHAKSTNGVCDVCGGTVLDVSGVTPNITGWADVCPAQEIKFGQSLTISGAQTSAMAENYSTILYEFTEGFTGRADNYGWLFPNGSQFSGYEGTALTIKDGNGKVQEYKTSDDFWKTFKAIAKDSKWAVTATFDNLKTVSVTVVIRSVSGDYKDYVYTCSYSIAIDDTSLTSLHMRITSDSATAGKITAATITGAAFYAAKVEPCKTHTWDAKTGKCTVCATVCTHDKWTSSVSNGVLTSTCDTCGMTCSHSWKNSTCETCKYECTTHNYDKTAATGKCTICGAEHSHAYDKTAATGACTDCGYKCQHENVDAQLVCQDCGVKTCTTHDWSNGDGVCTICGTLCEHTGVTSGDCTTCGGFVPMVWSEENNWSLAEISLNDNQRLTLTSTMKTVDTTNNAYGYLMKLGFTSSNKFYYLRVDNYATNNDDWGNDPRTNASYAIAGTVVSSLTTVTDWPTFNSDKVGAKVVITATYQNGTFTLLIVMSNSNGNTYTQIYTVSGITDTSVVVGFCIDHSTIENGVAVKKIESCTLTDTTSSFSAGTDDTAITINKNQMLTLTSTFANMPGSINGLNNWDGYLMTLAFGNSKNYFLRMDNYWADGTWAHNVIEGYPIANNCNISDWDTFNQNKKTEKIIIKAFYVDGIFTVVLEHYYKNSTTVSAIGTYTISGLTDSSVTFKIRFDDATNNGDVSQVLSTMSWS